MTNFPLPEMRDGHRLIHVDGHVVYVLSFKPQYVIVHKTGKKRGETKAVFNSKAELRQYLKKQKS